MSISRELSKFIEPGGQLEYDNTTSGLSATTVKSAIDELNTLLGGGNVGSQATFNVYEFTATASQTTFSLSSNHGQGSDITAGAFADGVVYIITGVGTTDFVALYGASSNTVGVTFTATTDPGTGTGTAKVVADYIPGYIKVYLNGVFLSETDYVASDGDNIVLDTGADVGALLSVVVLDSFNTATQLRVLGVDAGAPDNSLVIDSSGNVGVAGSVAATGGNFTGQVQFNGTAGVQLDNGAQAHTWVLDDNFTSRFNIGTSSASATWKFGSNNNAYLAVSPSGIDVTGSVTADGLVIDATSDSDSIATITSTATANNTQLRLGTNGNDSVISGSGSSNGALAFKVFGTEHMRIDSSGNVGINATTIAANGLQIGNTSSTDTEQLFLYSNKAIFSINTDGATNAAGTTITYSWANGGQGPLKFDNATTTVMTLDASGNVGIGTTLAGNKLVVKRDGTTDGTNAQIVSENRTGAAGQYALFASSFDNGSGSGFKPVAFGAVQTAAAGRTADFIIAVSDTDNVDLSTDERMRIRSDGFVGIGNGGLAATRLSVTNSVVGANIETTSANAGHEGLIVNRQNSFGTSISINKAGAAIGGISVVDSDPTGGGGELLVASGNTGLKFDDQVNYIRPANAAGGLRDNIVDLGKSDSRFKDLYLSGTAKSQAVELEDIKAKDTSGLNLQTSDGQKRVVLDNSGNLLVGKTATAFGTAGVEASASSGLWSTRSGFPPLALNRLSTEGPIADFYKDGVSEGSIGVASDVFKIFATKSSANCGIGFFSNSTVRPLNNSGALSDNAIDLGDSGTRWDDIYATNGTIQTSDRNEKQDIEELSDAEQRVAVAAKGLLRKFRWKSSVAEKGDEARTHFGIIAQDLQAAFAAEGLDAGDYAMFINSTWTDEETGEERSRMGVRYSELLAFIIAAI